MNPGVPPVLTQQAIVDGLHGLGLSAGDQAMVHSSFKSLGPVVGGPETVILALMEVLTCEGTLVMPSFNHGKAFEADSPGIFDPRTTPTTNGIIAQTFWQMDGVHRSLNPTHSFAAWGKQALAYTQNHHHTLTCGPSSPLGLLARAGGFGLLIGVDYRRYTFHHVVETTLTAPCISQRTVSLPMRLPDGQIVQGRTWNWRETSCRITDCALYTAEIERRGIERQATIGQSRVRFVRLLDTFPVIARCLRNGVGDAGPCSTCSVQPQRTLQTVPSDWNNATQSRRAPAEYGVELTPAAARSKL